MERIFIIYSSGSDVAFDQKIESVGIRRMILQQLVWKNEELEGTQDLYYHADSTVHVLEGKLVIPASAVIRFDTYFNAFIAKTWERYTTVKQLYFHLYVNGVASICLRGEKVEQKQDVSGSKEVIFSINLSDSPYYYLEVKSKEKCILEYGYFEAEEKCQTVKLALATCTFNRQKDIVKNIALLKRKNNSYAEKILEHIYVIDNASNLDRDDIEADWVSLVWNKNTGGAGGFTKGLQEAMTQKEITHIVLMDDDVHIEFEAFCRIKSFLSYIKEEYKEHFIGGAMFRTDIPYILHASGEDWDNGYINNVFKSTDVRTFEQVIDISEPVETKQAYAGWWLCCIPRSHVEKKGNPIPFFLHCDDVEYSLRSGKPPIYLNGIVVWHEEFEDKRSSVIEYYDTRNRLITNSIYKSDQKKKDAIVTLCERFYATVCRYRYLDFALSTKAAEDFLKGPKWLYELDSETYHKKLSEQGYKTQTIEEYVLSNEIKNRSKANIILHYLLPAQGTTTLKMGAKVECYAGKKEVLLIDVKAQKGLLVRKSWKETFVCLLGLIKIIFKLSVGYSKVEQEWNMWIKTNRI